MAKTFYISTSIPYVNAAPHIGHALEFVQADSLARFARQYGKDVFFLSGTDDNALKNSQAAEVAGVPVKKWVDNHSAIFQKLLAELNISNDDFIRTSSEKRHILGAQKLWSSCRQEDIYKKKYSGLYCLGCEEFKQEKDLTDNECPEHPGKKLELVEEENYFFKLSNYQKQLEEIISTDKLKIIPESRKNEMLSFIKSGLDDFSISRSRERAKDWGVFVPGDDDQIMYVWFDALANYITALDYADDGEKFNKYWVRGDEIIHIIGKGINRFHSIYWPAMLLSAGVTLPKTIFIHGYLTIGGQKISKTLGNVIDPFEVIKKYGSDATRYFLLRETPSDGDGDFSYAKFEERYNADLANGLGNFASRVLTLGEKLGKLAAVEIDQKTADAIESARKLVTDRITDFKIHDALAAIWELISYGDKYVNDHKPWSADLAEVEKQKIIFNAAIILDNISALLQSFLPVAADKITSSICWASDDILELRKLEILFPRLDSQNMHGLH
ncbi:MAG: methionine--tRNA ligase [bacterium]|nr:methionine--tRNA ligase [bacterium]